MGGPFPQHGVRHAALDLAQGAPPPRTPSDRAHRLGSVSPPPALPASSSPCASSRRGQSKPHGLGPPPAPPRFPLASAAGSPCRSLAGAHPQARRGQACRLRPQPQLPCVRQRAQPCWPQRGQHPTGGAAATSPLRAQPAHAHWAQSAHSLLAAQRGGAASLPGGSAGVTRRRQIHNPLTLQGLRGQTGACCQVWPRATKEL